jgi:hypothetical protein
MEDLSSMSDAELCSVIKEASAIAMARRSRRERREHDRIVDQACMVLNRRAAGRPSTPRVNADVTNLRTASRATPAGAGKSRSE